MLASSLSTRRCIVPLKGLAPNSGSKPSSAISPTAPSVNSTSMPWALRRLVGDSWGAAPSFSSMASQRSEGGRGGSPAPSSPLAAPVVVGCGRRVRMPCGLPRRGTRKGRRHLPVSRHPWWVSTKFLGVLSGRTHRGATVLAAGQHAFGLALQLPDPLTGDPELFAYLGERRRLLFAQAVALDENVTMALGQLLDGICEPVHLHLPDDRARNLRGALVLYELADLRGVGLRAKRLVEARGVPQRALQVANVFYRPAEPPGHFLVSGLALELGGELVVEAGHLAKLVAPVHRHPDGAPLVGHRPLDGLPHPPGGVRGEAEALLGVELLHGLHQAYVSLLDQVLEG